MCIRDRSLALQRQQEARRMEAPGGAEARGAGGASSAGPAKPGARGLAGGRWRQAGLRPDQLAQRLERGGAALQRP
eukprot:11555267-Alexandrium_andersonii.AAC.1